MGRAAEIENLDCRMEITRGALLVLSTRFDEMWALRESALNWEDIEGVHDMRVASRRLRGALQDFSPFLTSLRINRLRRNLRDIARSLGTVRDYDVSIVALEEFERDAPAEVRAGLARLAGRQRGEREEFRQSLAEALTDDQREQSYALFRRMVDSLGFAAGRWAGEDVSFREAGRRVIARRVKEVNDLSPSLYAPFEVEPLHQLRIAAKRLRYAIELFSICWGDLLPPFAAEIAKLQSSLGELHDCDEWIARLGQELSGREEETGEERAAAFWLMGRFARRRAKYYAAALAQWQEWEKTDLFRRLFDILTAESRPAGS